jgi:hypothetical protein
MSSEQKPESLNLDRKVIRQLSAHEQVINFLQKKFARIGRSSAINLATLLFNDTSTDIPVKSFKEKSSDFIRRNSLLVETRVVNEKEKYFLKATLIEEARASLLSLISKISTSLKSTQDDDTKWEKTTLDGEDVFEATKHSTFHDVRRTADEEGKNANFRYSFKKPDLKESAYQNVESLQMVKLQVNSRGENFDFPLVYNYLCPECGHEMSMKEYEVASTNGRMKCKGMIFTEGKNGSLSEKRCNTPLNPVADITVSKDAYIYSVQLKDQYGAEIVVDAMSFRRIPQGQCIAVIQRIPRQYSRNMLFILDYERIERDPLKLPEKQKDEHYLMTLVKTMDKYVKDKTGYEHFGFLPIKLAYIIQYMSCSNQYFKNDLHVSLSGERSTGKSQFAKMWGLALYSEDMYITSASSVSIPKLRGTMETMYLFNREFRYQYTGLMGIYKHIFIDELKDNPDLKEQLKQYGLEPNYDYSKQGGNNAQTIRTAQWSVAQNIDIKYKKNFEKDVRKVYSELSPFSDGDKVPEWEYDVDLDLKLSQYKNRYLRYAIRKVRANYERNQIFWQDGSEIANAQRYFFQFFLSRNKKSVEMQEVIKGNNNRNVVYENSELKATLCNDNMKRFCAVEANKYVEGTNDLEYFKHVDELLEQYDVGHDPRINQIGYMILKIIRMYDRRTECNQSDLKIFQYIIENMYNKIEIADTHEFIIHGPAEKTEEDEDIKSGQTNDPWGYEATLDSFDGKTNRG